MEFYGIRATPYDRVLADPTMPGAEWFAGARLNYAEHLVGLEEDRERVAVVARSQTRGPRELTFGELIEQAGRVRAWVCASESEKAIAWSRTCRISPRR